MSILAWKFQCSNQSGFTIKIDPNVEGQFDLKEPILIVSVIPRCFWCGALRHIRSILLARRPLRVISHGPTDKPKQDNRIRVIQTGFRFLRLASPAGSSWFSGISGQIASPAQLRCPPLCARPPIVYHLPVPQIMQVKYSSL